MSRKIKAVGFDDLDYCLCLVLQAECPSSSEDELTALTVQVWLTVKNTSSAVVIQNKRYFLWCV